MLLVVGTPASVYPGSIGISGGGGGQHAPGPLPSRLFYLGVLGFMVTTRPTITSLSFRIVLIYYIISICLLFFFFSILHFIKRPWPLQDSMELILGAAAT